MSSKPANPENFNLVSLIGKGGFAEVWQGKHDAISSTVAVKVISKNFVRTQEERTRLLREFNIQKKFKHPFLATVYQMSENLINYYLIMEFLPGGTLLDKISQEGLLPESIALHYFTQIVFTIQYLHDVLHVAHRDLKAENIMLDKDNNIRIIDFGLSHEINKDGQFNTKCGSPKYAAPELYDNGTYTKAVDVWSAGVILYYMTTGDFPFRGNDRYEVARRVRFEEPIYPHFLSSEMKDLLSQMLDKDPECRISFDRVLKHPWTRKHKEINPKLIDFDETDSLVDRIYKRENYKLEKMPLYSPLKSRSRNPSALTKNLSNPAFKLNLSPQKIGRKNKQIDKSISNFGENANVNTNESPNSNLANGKQSVIDRLCASGKFRPKIKEARSDAVLHTLKSLNDS